MTLQPRPASEAASCDPYAVAARDPAARSCPWDGRSTGCGRPHGSCAVTAIRVCPEATILSRSVAEAQLMLSFWARADGRAGASSVSSGAKFAAVGRCGRH